MTDELSSISPEIGQMPTPRYMPFVYEGTQTRWIGVDAYSANGELKEFIFYRNQDVDLSAPQEETADHLAALVARFAVDSIQADIAIGPAVDLEKSDRKTGRVVLLEDESAFGVYVRRDQRERFDFRFGWLTGLKDEATLRRMHPEEFEDAFQRARAVVPKFPPSQTQPAQQ